MPNKITLYHNPRCSKSRAALEWLKNREIDVAVVEYLKEPPTADTLRSIVALLNIKPSQLLRTGDSAYRELRLDKGNHSDEELLNIMADNPILIERPIVTTQHEAAIGRPLDNIIELIDEL